MDFKMLQTTGESKAPLLEISLKGKGIVFTMPFIAYIVLPILIMRATVGQRTMFVINSNRKLAITRPIITAKVTPPAQATRMS